MIQMFISLEPRFEDPGTIVLDELEESGEVLFFREGSFKIGFEINGKHFYALKFKNVRFLREQPKGEGKEVIPYQDGEPIGQYYCTFNIKSQFIHKTISYCNGFFIRKKSWLKMLSGDQDELLIECFKTQVKKSYKKQEVKLMRQKQFEINKMKQRSDINHFKYVTTQEEISTNWIIRAIQDQEVN